MKSPLTIGLTGGIGSGKSAVAQCFRELGVPIIDADEIARQVVAPGTPALQAIHDHLGPTFLQNGQLNRDLLRQHIFKHPEHRVWLEKLLHPLIREAMQKQIQASHASYCILVIPLLIENLPHPLVKRILVVDAPIELQLRRVMARDHLNQADAEKIIQAQVSREARLQLADDVLVNDGDLGALMPKVAALHEHYLALLGASFC